LAVIVYDKYNIIAYITSGQASVFISTTRTPTSFVQGSNIMYCGEKSQTFNYTYCLRVPCLIKLLLCTAVTPKIT